MKMQDRIFTTKDKDDKELELRFKRPNQAVLSKAELVYRKAYSSAFRDEIITNAEVEKLLRERGLWDEKEQAKQEEIRQQIFELEERLKDEGISDEEGVNICNTLDLLRLSVLEANSIYQSIADNTCETIAKEAQNGFLCSECVVENKTGNRVYKNVDDYRNRLDEPCSRDAFQETVIGMLEVRVGHELPTNIMEEYPENKWRASRLEEKAQKAAEDAKDAEAKIEELEKEEAAEQTTKKKKTKKSKK